MKQKVFSNCEKSKKHTKNRTKYDSTPRARVEAREGLNHIERHSLTIKVSLHASLCSQVHVTVILGVNPV